MGLLPYVVFIPYLYSSISIQVYIYSKVKDINCAAIIHYGRYIAPPTYRPRSLQFLYRLVVLRNPSMAPRKRQQSVSPPRRKSARLAAQSTSSSHEQLRGLITTNIEASETWAALKEAAKERIPRYQSENRVHEEKLQPSLNAFIEWLPEGGRESVARDIVNAITDGDLYSVFHSLLTDLTAPSKTRLL